MPATLLDIPNNPLFLDGLLERFDGIEQQIRVNCIHFLQVTNTVEQDRKISYESVWVIKELHADLLHFLTVVVGQLNPNFEGFLIRLGFHGDSILFTSPAPQHPDIVGLLLHERLTEFEPLGEALLEDSWEFLSSPDQSNLGDNIVNVIQQGEALQSRQE